MTSPTVLPAPGDLRGITVDDKEKVYWFTRLVAIAVKSKDHGEYYEIEYIDTDGVIADNIIDSSDFVHGFCADMPLAQWEAENELTPIGGAAV